MIFLRNLLLEIRNWWLLTAECSNIHSFISTVRQHTLISWQDISHHNITERVIYMVLIYLLRPRTSMNAENFQTSRVNYIFEIAKNDPLNIKKTNWFWPHGKNRKLRFLKNNGFLWRKQKVYKILLIKTLPFSVFT